MGAARVADCGLWLRRFQQKNAGSGRVEFISDQACHITEGFACDQIRHLVVARQGKALCA